MPRFGIFLGALAIALSIGSGACWAQAPVGRSDQTAGKVLDINGKVLDIVGLEREVKGIALGIPGSHVMVTPQEIRIELAARRENDRQRLWQEQARGAQHQARRFGRS